jgi:acyl-CoA thioester hydrolase
MGADLKSPPFSIALRVYYQDTDAGGVTFHAAYLEFFERSRIEWLRERGFDSRVMTGEFRCLFIVRKLRIEYRQPALLDDLLQVTTEIQQLGRAQLTFAQQVFRDQELLAEAAVNLACVGASDLRPMAIPEVIRSRCAADADEPTRSIDVRGNL